MNEIARLLAANDGYAFARAHVGGARPGWRLAVITCMDAASTCSPSSACTSVRPTSCATPEAG